MRRKERCVSTPTWATAMRDALGRKIEYLRVSVTDRCNLRCVYCMPPEGVACVRHEEVLRFEEILQICRCAVRLGVRSIKLTGGEPLARLGVAGLVKQLKELPGLEQVTLTSNGVLLEQALPELSAAGLDAVNISLDTLDPARYEEITRGKGLEQALAAVDQALALGITVKLNCLPIKELNADGLVELAELARTRPVDVRFIELMPIGYGKCLTPIPSAEVAGMLQAAFGELRTVAKKRGNGPARYVQAEGFKGCFGLIDSISSCFCADCNRVRLTSTGFLKLCLHHNAGIDLRAIVRQGITDEALTECLRAAILQKPARQCFGEAVPDEEHRGMSQIGG